MKTVTSTRSMKDFAGTGPVRLANPAAPVVKRGIVPTPHEYGLLEQAFAEASGRAKACPEEGVRAALIEQLEWLRQKAREIYTLYTDRYASKSQQLRAAFARLKPGESCWVDDNAGVSPIAEEFGYKVTTRKLLDGGYEVVRLR